MVVCGTRILNVHTVKPELLSGVLATLYLVCRRGWRGVLVETEDQGVVG
jgi:hypothetical protein